MKTLLLTVIASLVFSLSAISKESNISNEKLDALFLQKDEITATINQKFNSKLSSNSILILQQKASLGDGRVVTRNRLAGKFSTTFTKALEKNDDFIGVRPENREGLCGANDTISVTTVAIQKCCKEDDNGNCTQVKECKVDIATCKNNNQDVSNTYTSASSEYECSECGGETTGSDYNPESVIFE